MASTKALIHSEEGKADQNEDQQKAAMLGASVQEEESAIVVHYVLWYTVVLRYTSHLPKSRMLKYIFVNAALKQCLPCLHITNTVASYITRYV